MEEEKGKPLLISFSKEERTMLEEKARAVGLPKANFIKMLIKLSDVSKLKEFYFK